MLGSARLPLLAGGVTVNQNHFVDARCMIITSEHEFVSICFSLEFCQLLSY